MAKSGFCIEACLIETLRTLLLGLLGTQVHVKFWAWVGAMVLRKGTGGSEVALGVVGWE